MSQSNEGDSPVKGGKEPVKGLQRTIPCTRWLGGKNHVHTPSKEHQTRATTCTVLARNIKRVTTTIMAGKYYQYRKMVFN